MTFHFQSGFTSSHSTECCLTEALRATGAAAQSLSCWTYPPPLTRWTTASCYLCLIRASEAKCFLDFSPVSLDAPSMYLGEDEPPYSIPPHGAAKKDQYWGPLSLQHAPPPACGNFITETQSGRLLVQAMDTSLPFWWTSAHTALNPYRSKMHLFFSGTHHTVAHWPTLVTWIKFKPLLPFCRVTSGPAPICLNWCSFLSTSSLQWILS